MSVCWCGCVSVWVCVGVCVGGGRVLCKGHGGFCTNSLALLGSLEDFWETDGPNKGEFSHDCTMGGLLGLSVRFMGCN